MNRYITLLLIAFCTVTLAAQECNTYYPLKKGTSVQMTSYNNRNRPTAITDYEVLSVSSSSKGKTATVKGTASDGKGKNIASAEFDIICDGNNISIDYETLLNPQLLEQFGQFDYSLSGTNLEWPGNLSVGQKLPDANMILEVSMQGMNMKVVTEIKNRKVVGSESLKTPAGTFDCMVITYDTSVEMMGTTHTSSSKVWISKGVGPVKDEISRNGKVESYTLLTAASL